MLPTATPVLSRWSAAGWHLAASAALALFAAVLIFGYWYPQPYTAAAGAGRLVLLLIGLHLALGPLLTLIVYKHGKKGMAFDIAFIATVQFVALAYGLFVIAQSRPVFIVVTRDMTFLTTAREVSDADLAQAIDPTHRRRSWFGPVLVAAPPPESTAERNEVLTSGLAGKDINALPKYFRNYDAAAADLLRDAPSLSALEQSEAARSRVQAMLDQVSMAADELKFLPLRGRNPEMDSVVVFDRQHRVVGVIQTDPWPAMPGRAVKDG
jgi:hypothetical protein